MSNRAFEIWMDWSFKCTIVLVLGWLFAWMCRDRSAAIRHSIWVTTLVATLLFPVVNWLVPSWTIWLNLPRELELWGWSSSIDEWKFGVVTLWAAGTVIFFAPIVVGQWYLSRKWQRSRPLHPATASILTSFVHSELGSKRRVPIAICPEISSPLTWGSIFPAILLPESAEGWSLDRLRVVVIHELAHIQRRDCATQLLGLVARAVYWFHPLTWHALRSLRREQEAACDDSLIRAGTDPCDYAEHLLSVTANLPGRWIERQGATAMGKTPEMENRIRAILDLHRERRPLTLSMVAIVVLAGTLLATLVGTGRFSTLPHFDLAQTSAPTAALDYRETGTTSATMLAFAGRPTEIALAPPSTKDQIERSETPILTSESAEVELRHGKKLPSLAEVQAKLRKVVGKEIDESELRVAAIRGMLQMMPDAEFNTYYSPEEFQVVASQSQGQRVGIGVWFSHDKELRVITPMPGSPGLKAGMRAGDCVLEINGIPFNAEDPNRSLRQIPGQPGTPVRVRVRHKNNQEEELSIVRQPFQLEVIHGFRRNADHRWNFWIHATNRIGYLMVSEFAPATTPTLKAIVEQLVNDGAQGLIIDLRFSPGGVLQSAAEAADLFLDKGTVVTIHGPDEKRIIEADNAQIAAGLPIVVVINERTASSAEIVAGALQANKRAVLVGSRTYGKGSVQSIVPLDEGGAIRVSTGSFEVADGRKLQRTSRATSWGVDPDDGFYIPVDAKATDELREKMMERTVIDPDAPEIEDDQSPNGLIERYSDPQLAGALRTITARILEGKYEKVADAVKSAEANPNAQQRLDESKAKRDAMLREVERLDREVRELDQLLKAASLSDKK